MIRHFSTFPGKKNYKNQQNKQKKPQSLLEVPSSVSEFVVEQGTGVLVGAAAQVTDIWFFI